MYNSADHKEHIMAIAQACYDHQDMIWQEDWFELWDNHIVPLFNEVPLGQMPNNEANSAYENLRSLAELNADTWFQEDWYAFCDEVFTCILAIAQEEGWAKELLKRFPYVFQLS